MSRLLLALLLAAIAPSAALAQTTYELRSDLSAQVKAEDRKLNDVYKQLTAALGPKAKQALVRSELAWLKFREAEVKAEADRYRGGTFEPVLALNADIRLLKQRTHELEGWLVQVTTYDEGWSADWGPDGDPVLLTHATFGVVNELNRHVLTGPQEPTEADLHAAVGFCLGGLLGAAPR